MTLDPDTIKQNNIDPEQQHATKKIHQIAILSRARALIQIDIKTFIDPNSFLLKDVNF